MSCLANCSMAKRCSLRGRRVDTPALLTPYVLYNENRAFSLSELSRLSSVVLVKRDYRNAICHRVYNRLYHIVQNLWRYCPFILTI
jgi:hypothetical protein